MRNNIQKLEAEEAAQLWLMPPEDGLELHSSSKIFLRQY